ncbi:unnamed protein product [Leptidea sinapis]|uniref:Uncharacterized protein n=1 Tax=Leptidea sinapis TaxID=189913 RepID=A0A5E4PZ31_9NEOP|nr:unnamed protein product [Leptidea sinapis]
MSGNEDLEGDASAQLCRSTDCSDTVEEQRDCESEESKVAEEGMMILIQSKSVITTSKGILILSHKNR